MLLAEELRALREKLEANASFKERAFYRHLCGSPLDYPHGNDLSEQEKVVLAAFCSRGPDCHSSAEKIRGTKPIKGLHYSNNLIDLAAFANLSLDKEIDNLKNYANTHSTKEFFVLSRLFPDVVEYPPTAVKEIDHIALKLFKGSLNSDDKPAIASAIQASEDLLDVYILNSAYQTLLDHQPATQYRSDAIELAQQLSAVIRRVDAFVRVAVASAVAYGFFMLYRFLIPIIIDRWNQMEPRLFLIQLVFGSVVLVIWILIGVAPDRLKFINTTLRFVGTVGLRIIGIKRRSAENLIARYLNT